MDDPLDQALEELQAVGKEGGQDAKDEAAPAAESVKASDDGGKEDPAPATEASAEEASGQVSEEETQPAAAPPPATEGDPSQDGTDQETGDLEGAEADSDENARQAEQPTAEETPLGSDAPETAGAPPTDGASEEADAGEDAAILEELLSDNKAPDAEPTGNEASGDETTDTKAVLQGGTEGDGLDEETQDDADARAYEELVTGELDAGSEENEEILNLEEPAETEDGGPREETDGEGQPAPASTEESPGETDQADAFDTGSVQTAGGLSDEERGDLDKLITGLKEASPEGISPGVMKGLRKQLKVTDQRVAKLGKMVLAYDRRLKACYEVIRLHHEKTEIMNRRIDALVAAMNNGKST